MGLSESHWCRSGLWAWRRGLGVASPKATRWLDHRQERWWTAPRQRRPSREGAKMPTRPEGTRALRGTLLLCDEPRVADQQRAPRCRAYCLRKHRSGESFLLMCEVMRVRLAGMSVARMVVALGEEGWWYDVWTISRPTAAGRSGGLVARTPTMQDSSARQLQQLLLQLRRSLRSEPSNASGTTCTVLKILVLKKAHCPGPPPPPQHHGG